MAFPVWYGKISSALVKKRFRRYNFHHGSIVYFPSGGEVRGEA